MKYDLSLAIHGMLNNLARGIKLLENAEARLLGTARVEAYKNMHFVDEERKEEFLLAAFIKGIRDRQVAEALEVLKPATISDAMKLVKSEMKRQQENESRRPEFVRATFEKHFNEENSQVKELTAQVRQMQLQLNHILAFIQRLENTKDNSLPIKVHQITPVLGNFMKNNIGNSHNRPSGGNYRQNLRKPIRPIICFNCNKEGHIARQCRQSSQIQRGTFKNVRQLHEDVNEVPSYCTDKQDDDLESKVSSENNCYAMNLVKNEKIRNNETRTRKVKLDPHGQEWLNYIKGMGPKPKIPLQTAKPQTVISNSRTEKAANKPLVKGRCEEKLTLIFLDTGAETNVMDSKFFGELRQKHPNLILTPSTQIIKCANGSKIKPLRSCEYSSCLLANGRR
jgi:hypothetical protein